MGSEPALSNFLLLSLPSATFSVTTSSTLSEQVNNESTYLCKYYRIICLEIWQELINWPHLYLVLRYSLVVCITILCVRNFGHL